MATTTGDVPTIDDDDDALVLPWWFSWWRVAIVSALATLALVGTIALLGRHRPPTEGSADVGFLHDMRTHHDQAVLMSMIYLDRPGTDTTLRVMAGETALGQQLEIGQMLEILAGWKAPEEADESAPVMRWMGHDMPAGQMPGMATPEQIDRLQAAEGRSADELFVKLMTAHHEGGVEMADAALGRVDEPRVRDFARVISRNQTVEITEMAEALSAG